MKAIAPYRTSMPPMVICLPVVQRFLIRSQRLNHTLPLPVGRDIFQFTMYYVCDVRSFPEKGW
jgi:hypothetical protein